MSTPSTHGAVGADLRSVIYALSDALDLVGIDDLAHGKRVGIMAAECLRCQGAGEEETRFVFDLGLLHDIGVSSTVTHGHLVKEFDWESSQTHCLTGYELLRDFVPLADMALPVRLHHTHWVDLVATDVDRQVALRANLIYLVDRVDALSAPHYADGSLLMNTERIRGEIGARAGSFFAPELVELFLEASRSESFWLNLEPRSIQTYLNDMRTRGRRHAMTIGELKQLATIFSRIVDAKSPFTAEHSLGVARLARLLGERCDLPAARCDQLEIAGLLHDIGKLRVPDEILDKPAKLDERERKVMNAHSFETYQILKPIPGFDEFALWAASHHESPGGDGYPFRVSAERLCLEARILRVADIFQAMAQDRPYRAGLPAEKVAAFMQELVAQGRVDADLVALTLADLPAAMAAARPAG